MSRLFGIVETMKVRECFLLAKNVFIGKARNISDESLFDQTTLIALFAWVGLGADGLSVR
jgi:hypothetical protein